MTPNEYQERCLDTAINDYVKSTNDLLLQGVMGLCGESGECIDIVKKHKWQGHHFGNEEREHLARELGDALFYLATTAYSIGWTLEDIMLLNREKLSVRYKDHFDPEASIHRREGDI